MREQLQTTLRNSRMANTAPRVWVRRSRTRPSVKLWMALLFLTVRVSRVKNKVPLCCIMSTSSTTLLSATRSTFSVWSSTTNFDQRALEDQDCRSLSGCYLRNKIHRNYFLKCMFKTGMSFKLPYMFFVLWLWSQLRCQSWKWTDWMERLHLFKNVVFKTIVNKYAYRKKSLTRSLTTDHEE